MLLRRHRMRDPGEPDAGRTEGRKDGKCINAMHFDKRLATLEQCSYSEDHNVIVVLLHPGEDDATKAERIVAAKRDLGLAEDDPRRVIVVRFGVDDRTWPRSPSAG
jgi:hypothetical protein